MTAVATFSLITSLNPAEVKRRISETWKGDALEVHVRHEPGSGELFCYLEWYFGGEKYDRMIKDVCRELLIISLDKSVFYYRDSNMPADAPTNPSPISTEQLSNKEYQPSLNFGAERFKVVG
jgi:hypothetical protein